MGSSIYIVSVGLDVEGSSDAGWWWCSSEQCLSVEGFHCGTCLCKWQRMRKKEREADRALTKCWLKCQNLDSNWLYIYTTMYLFLFSITHDNIQHYKYRSWVVANYVAITPVLPFNSNILGLNLIKRQVLGTKYNKKSGFRILDFLNWSWS